jgi:prohibitin 1
MNNFDQILKHITRLGFGLVAGTLIISNSAVVIDGGQRGLVFDRYSGLKQKVLTEGLNFVVPILQYPIIFEVRTAPKVISSHTGTKDLQTVKVEVRLLYRPDIEYLDSVCLNLGKDYDERILPSIGNEILKSIIAQYNAEQLLTQREQVSKEIRERLTQRASEFNIILEDVALTHLTFGKEFANACEMKQVAQQDAEKAKFLVQKQEQEARATIMKAEGEAEAGEILRNAIEMYGNNLLEIRRLEAAKKIADSLAKSPGVTYIPGGNNTLLNLPLN